MRPANRILHVDGDSFFASCEIALNPKLQERPVWVGGGRRGDGIVIAANRLAKKFGTKNGMACFEGKRLCPRGVLCKPHYDEYRRISAEMNAQFNKMSVMTGAQLALREMEDSFKNPKAKCPFVPQREMLKQLWGTDADPLAHKGNLEKRLAKVSKQSQFGH